MPKTVNLPSVWVVEVKDGRRWVPSCTSKASETREEGLDDLKTENELFTNLTNRLAEYRRVK